MSNYDFIATQEWLKSQMIQARSERDAAIAAREKAEAERNAEIKETDRMRVKLIRVEDELAARSSDLRAVLSQRDREHIAREKAEAKAARLAAVVRATEDISCISVIETQHHEDKYAAYRAARAAVDAHGDLEGGAA